MSVNSLQTLDVALDNAELSSRIGWNSGECREQIGSWKPENIAVERIESLPFSASLKNSLDDLRWQAQVEYRRTIADAIRVTRRRSTARIMTNQPNQHRWYSGLPLRPQPPGPQHPKLKRPRNLRQSAN